MNIKKTIGALMMCAISATPMMAQQTSAESYQPCTYQEMEQLTVNEQVTTVITASEPIRFVDINDRENRVVGKQGRMAKALVYGRYIELAEEPVWQRV